MKKVRFALVGLGAIGQERLLVYKELMHKRNVELVAICDKSEEKCKLAISQIKVPYYQDMEEMLKKQKNIDVVDICTPHFNHHILGKIAAEYGKHVFVEKPLSLTLPCADLLIIACKKANVYLGCGENYFRMPNDRVTIKLLRSGIIGEIIRAYAIDKAIRSRSPLYPAEWQKVLGLAGGGHCLEIGIHRMSQLRLYINNEADSIVGLTKVFGNSLESWGHAIIKFKNNAVGIYDGEDFIEKKISTSVIGPYNQVIGSKGTILIDSFGVHLYLITEKWAEHKEIPIVRITQKINNKEVLNRIIVKTEPPIIWENPFRDCPFNDYLIGIADEIIDMANSVLNDRDPEYDGIQGRKDLELVEALYESSLKGMYPIRLPITTMTLYEQKVHEAYKEKFGHDPLEV
jgi:predicted dehydrogenase